MLVAFLRHWQVMILGDGVRSYRELDSIERFYARIARTYDGLFGPLLDAGRRAGVRRLDLTPGSRVLEVGVGTALTAPLYPSHCRVIGIDCSEPMLQVARARLAAARIQHVVVQRMNAHALRFTDGAFDVAYAAYVLSAVADPARVLSEMARVCRPGGKVVILNRFCRPKSWIARLESAASPLTTRCGFRAGLDPDPLIAAAGLTIVDERRVNLPPLWSLITCVRST
jgi:phosphatidylethanolamine/phosphatidyl-N-methylethanolamine N-methyltransferase